ncbi:MAG: hypothetical protein AAGD25_13480 [Cyanobacteria bacterium P01_F01_bin.150]
MVDISSYWTMKILQADGRLRRKHFPDVQRWFSDRFADLLNTEMLSEADCQRSLWTLWQTDPEIEKQAELSLRCRLSHLITLICHQLARQFGTRYGFSVADLQPLVLDDDGTVKASAYPFRSLTILNRYQPEKGSLGSWTTRLIKNDPEINRFLMEQGLYLITPWAILNDTKVEQLSRFLPHLSQGELEAAGQLLHAYHRVYRRDRFKQRQQNTAGSSRQRCENPTDEQLKRINPQASLNIVFQQLYDLADQLREARIARRTKTIPPSQRVKADDIHNQIENLSMEPDDGADENSTEHFLTRYRQQFRATLDQSIAHVVQQHMDRHQKRNPLKGKLYLEALGLFHGQGYSMGAIAKQLDLANQVAVTRLLQLRQLRREVGIYWLQQLKQSVVDDLVTQLSAEHLDRISDQLDQVLMEEIGAVEQAAAAEAQIPKNRTTNSLFARRLCAVLPHLKNQA